MEFLIFGKGCHTCVNVSTIHLQLGYWIFTSEYRVKLECNYFCAAVLEEYDTLIIATHQKPTKTIYTILCWWYCKLKLSYLWFVCLTTTHTHALKLTKLHGETTLRTLRQIICMEEQVVTEKLTLEPSPVEFYSMHPLHWCSCLSSAQGTSPPPVYPSWSDMNKETCMDDQ